MNKYLTIWLVVILMVVGLSFPVHAQDGSGVEPRLTLGGMGRALENDVEVYFKPTLNSSVQPMILSAGGLFTLLGGPVSEGDTTWWQIEFYVDDQHGVTSRQTGWIYEWIDGTYVVEPLPDVTRTYVAPDATMTFMYPEAYHIVLDTRDMVVLSNSDGGIIEPGSVMLAVYKSAYAVPSLTGSTGTPLELLAIDAAAGAMQGVNYGELIPVNLGINQAAYTLTSSPDIGMDSTVAIVAYGEEEASSMVMGLTVLDEASNGTAAVIALSRTLRVADADLLAETLTQRFALADDTYTMSVREDWAAEQFDNIVLVVNDSRVKNLASLDDIIAGQLIVFVYPTVASIENYPAGSVSENDVPSTVVSFLASMGTISGYRADGPMNADLTAGNYAAASWFAHGQTHDRLVITIENGLGDFVTFDAYAATGELRHFEPTLLAMLASVEAHPIPTP